jgi:outer membrane PBP1 activator LpoA protein
MSSKSILTLLMILVLAGTLSACNRKQQPDTLATPNALEQARARAASQQVSEPITPSRASNTNAYGKSNYIK